MTNEQEQKEATMNPPPSLTMAETPGDPVASGRRRGRPKGSKNKPKPEAVIYQHPVECIRCGWPIGEEKLGPTMIMPDFRWWSRNGQVEMKGCKKEVRKCSNPDCQQRVEVRQAINIQNP